MFKRRIVALVVFFLFLSSVVALAAAPVQERELKPNRQAPTQQQAFMKPWIKVMEPGDNFGTADDHTIRISWRYGGVGMDGGSVKIDIYKGGILLANITPNTLIGLDKSCSYDWRIGRGWALLKGQGGGGNFQIKITSLSNPDVSAMSPNFWITQMVY